jgi:hypothetical protein
MLDQERRLCTNCGQIVIYQKTEHEEEVTKQFAAYLPGKVEDSPPQVTDHCPKCRQSLSLKTTYKPTIASVQAFFSKAMSRGWVASAYTISGFLPGWKMYSYQEGLLKLIDTWYTTPGTNKSTGMTMISYGDNLLWIMHYGGTYQDEAMPVVMAALISSYESNQFFGGRGPLFFEHKGISYYNNPERSLFEYSVGTEYVKNGIVFLGNHTYECRWVW